MCVITAFFWRWLSGVWTERKVISNDKLAALVRAQSNCCGDFPSPSFYCDLPPLVCFPSPFLSTLLSLHALALPRTALPPLTIFVFLFFHIARFSIMATSPPQPSPSLSSNAHFSSQYTNGHLPTKPRPSDPSNFRPTKAYPSSIASTPEVQINGRPRQSRPSSSSASTNTHDETTWGSHFWVTLVDPQASLIMAVLVYYL